MRLGQPHVQGHETRLRPKPGKREKKRRRRPGGRQVRRAHRIEGELPTAALQHAEGEQDRDRSQMSHEQVDEAGATDLGDAVLRGHEEVGRERHQLPGHHEAIGVVGEQYPAHAGEEQVVLQAEQSRRGPLTLPEIAPGKHRDAGGRGSEEQKEEARERIEPQMERQVGETQRQNEPLGATGEQARARKRCERETEHRTERKERPARKAHARGPQQAREADKNPGRKQCGTARQWRWKKRGHRR